MEGSVQILSHIIKGDGQRKGMFKVISFPNQSIGMYIFAKFLTLISLLCTLGNKKTS